MNSSERIDRVLKFQTPDRLPFVELCPYWDETIDRWGMEGLPEHLDSGGKAAVEPEVHLAICDYFGLDRVAQIWIGSRKPECPAPSAHGAPLIRSYEDYQAFKTYLYPEPPVSSINMDRIMLAEARGDAWWVALDGFFRFPRILLGIEQHLVAFYDQPELMNAINDDNLQFLCRAVETLCAHHCPQYIVISEDMTYNRGPMISKPLFESMLMPLYSQLAPFIKSKGVPVLIDSDGLIDELIYWFQPVGVDGYTPLERRAGVDIVEYRRHHGRLLLAGGFDKICMTRGEQAMRGEFERILPVMRQGGYIPCVDHQTPPEVSLADYRLYIDLLKEYCKIAAQPLDVGNTRTKR